jgi:hypothetical protein
MDDQTRTGLLGLIQRSTTEYFKSVTDRGPDSHAHAEGVRNTLVAQATTLGDAELLSAVAALTAIKIGGSGPVPEEFGPACDRVSLRVFVLRMESAAPTQPT